MNEVLKPTGVKNSSALCLSLSNALKKNSGVGEEESTSSWIDKQDGVGKKSYRQRRSKDVCSLCLCYIKQSFQAYDWQLRDGMADLLGQTLGCRVVQTTVRGPHLAHWRCSSSSPTKRKVTDVANCMP